MRAIAFVARKALDATRCDHLIFQPSETMNNNLYDTAKQIRALMDADWLNDEPQLSEAMAELKARFFQEILHCDRRDILEKIIDLDADFGMPFDVIQATCERLSEIKHQKSKLQYQPYYSKFVKQNKESNTVKI